MQYIAIAMMEWYIFIYLPLCENKGIFKKRWLDIVLFINPYNFISEGFKGSEVIKMNI
jgi:hypothetical protein